MALKKASQDLREASRDDAAFFLSIDSTIRFFEQSIANCKKFSIGNCHELALMALHYMIEEQPDINAEVYHIEGGDHAFLVVGRKIDSDPHRPDTWGDEAYICDPWSNNVYPANEYLTKTKNFFQVPTADGAYTNHIEDFDPLRHKLSPVLNQNTNYILSTAAKSNTILLSVFVTINEKYLSIYDDLIKDLSKIAEKLKDKYGEDDPKFKIIKEKIVDIQKITNELKDNFKKHVESIEDTNSLNAYLPHKDLNDSLQQMMKKQLQELRTQSALSISEKNNLNKYRKEDSLVTMIMKFLNIKPTSSRHYISAVKKSEDQISELSDLVKSSFRK